ncbi:hypothetical protein QFC19_004832 [Naganishia cerealis]|uniref:Uncharacterized protein n=1 Tax=Naganishia cerealis TaxID=610337 RepID=A0ACC2VTG1_9TREE|nr:hypothetical protein QFC19_004832 [Naganishia cerealis]
MSAPKSQGNSFHPSQFVGKASTSQPTNEWKDFTEDEDEVDANQFDFVTKDHVLFCIDASASMQDPLPDEMFQDDDFSKFTEPDLAEKVRGKGKSTLHVALEVAHKVERAKALTGPHDSVGVLLYNVNPDTLPPTLANGERSETFRRGTVLYQPLRQINAEEIKRLKSLLEDANAELARQPEKEGFREEPNILRETFQPISGEETLDMADVFECCNHVFRDAGTKLNGTKRVFLITNNDRPERAGGQSDPRSDPRGPARTRFLDLNSLGVSVDPYFVNRAGEEFDAAFYWNDVLILDVVAEDDEPEENEVREKLKPSSVSNGMEQLRALMEDAIYKSGSKKVFFSVPLKIGGKDGDITIGVHGYSLISATAKPASRLYDLSGRLAREVKTKTEFNAASTGVKLDPTEIGYAYSFGKSDVATDILDNYWSEGLSAHRDVVDDEGPEDAKFGKGLGDLDDSMDDKGKIDVKQPIRTRAYAGSTRTFSALLKACLDKKKHALALVVTRKNSTPVFACLIPQAESFDSDGSQDDPPGFHMITLPYADDLRTKPDKLPNQMLQCTDEQRNIMTRLIKQFAFSSKRYVSSLYPNPALAFFYAKLQSIAFDEPVFEASKVEDKTKPQVSGMHKRAGRLMKDFKEAVESDRRIGETPLARTAGTKRSATAADLDDFDPSHIEEQFACGKANKLLVEQLKMYARYKKIPLDRGLRKADLIELLKCPLFSSVDAEQIEFELKLEAAGFTPVSLGMGEQCKGYF